MKNRTAISALGLLVSAGAACAQIHGTPAGATSLGGGHTFSNPVGVPAGATSLTSGLQGARGYNVPRFSGSRPSFQIVPEHGRRDGERARRIIIPVAIPLYGAYYPYSYPYYSSTEISTADYTQPEAANPNLTSPQIVVAPVQQPPQIIVIDNRGVHDASDEERQEALATSKAAKRPKVAEQKLETQPEAEDVGPMTVLVFRDGTRREVKNYAIMGKELIVLGAGSMRRIQLAELDLPATVKENDGRGLDFRLP